MARFLLQCCTIYIRRLIWEAKERAWLPLDLNIYCWKCFNGAAWYYFQVDSDKLFSDLRETIRNDEDIEEYLKKEMLERPQDSSRNSRSSLGPRERANERVVIEALKQKDLQDGRNLLMYAAFEGSLESFQSIVKVVEEKVREKLPFVRENSCPYCGGPLTVLIQCCRRKRPPIERDDSTSPSILLTFETMTFKYWVTTLIADLASNII